MKSEWINTINALNHKGEAFVLVTVLGIRGSAPSEPGVKMVVTEVTSYDTIGGGDLEYQAIAISRNMLVKAEKKSRIECFPLGSCLTQCCGGSVFLLFEPFHVSEFTVALFGAGHVGQSLAKILSELPCRVHWVEAREKHFPDAPAANMKLRVLNAPAHAIKDLPRNSYYIVMTHNHQIDFDICEAVLKRGDFRYLGLIGSKTKWLRFKNRLLNNGHAEDKIQLIRCPMGMLETTSKMPMEIAVSIAGEIINLYHQNDLPRQTSVGIPWKDLRLLQQQSE